MTIPVSWLFRFKLIGNFRSGEPLGQHNNVQEAQDELMNLMTIMYIAIQETLSDPEDMSSTQGKLCEFAIHICDTQLIAISGTQAFVG